MKNLKKVDQEEKIIYLTFDDGPDENTSQILDLLKKYNIKATFFNLGVQAEKRPELVKRVVKEGHTLGNHTWSHNPKLYENPDKFIEEVLKLTSFQENLTGKKLDKIFRFPFGSQKASAECIKAIEDNGYTYVDWNVYLQDGSRNPSPDKAYKLAVTGVNECSEIPVILTHCEREEKTGPLAALENIIKTLLDQGYTFKAIKSEKI